MKKSNKSEKINQKVKLINKTDLFKKKSLLFIILGIAAIFFIFINLSEKSRKNYLKTEILPKAIKKLLRDENAKFTLSDLKEKNGLYEFQLTWNNQTFPPSYITKDGKKLFTSGLEIDSLINPQPTTIQNQPKKITCEEIKKTNSPKLTAFIVADCPFGLHAQRVFKKTIEELPELSPYLDIKYIGSIKNGKITSMHGDKEAQENLRQICIREEQKDLYWNYVSCYMKRGDTKNCLTNVGIDVNSLNGCMEDKERGLKYAQKDFDLAKKFNIGGSPTFLINNQQIIPFNTLEERVPNNMKQTLCCAFKQKPEFCQKELSKDQVAVSFSETDEPQTQGTNTSAGCGN